MLTIKELKIEKYLLDGRAEEVAERLGINGIDYNKDRHEDDNREPFGIYASGADGKHQCDNSDNRRRENFEVAQWDYESAHIYVIGAEEAR